MPSFDVVSEVNWHEIENAIQQAMKEITHRFDFKGIQSNIEIDKKTKVLKVTCSEEGKLDAVNDVFQNKLVKRGVSLLSLDYQKIEPATGSSVRQNVLIQAGISKEKGKEIIKKIKNQKMKVQAQIQDEQVRVTAKSRDLLQSVIGFLKTEQDGLKLPLQFINFRD